MDTIYPHLAGSDSPPSRQNILTSFLRGRPRGTSQSHTPTSPVIDRDWDSPPPFPPPHLVVASPPSPGPSSNRRRSNAAPGLQPSISHNLPISTGLTQMLRRRRSGGALASSNTPQVPTIVSTTHPPSSMPVMLNVPIPITTGATHRIRLVPHLDSRRSLRFDPITRDVVEGEAALRIGRFTERSGVPISQANALNSNKLAFKSKVVSRAHAEVWCELGGKFYIKDTKSSSGTFLNHVRLSAASQDSRPFELKDGDTLQLGVDYQGGTEDIYKCVRIRVEIGREWQASANAFNTSAFRHLKSLATANTPTVTPVSKSSDKKPAPKSSISDCCICLFSVTIRQALFIAPCSHAFHYKCIRPMLEIHHPAFSCPLCRTFANLDDDVEIDAASFELEDDTAEKEASGPVSTPEDAEMLLLSPNMGRERDGAETEVEPDMGFGNSLRRIPVPPSIIDLAEGSDDDRDAFMVDVPNYDNEPPLPPLPEGEGLVPPPLPERELPGARSASVSDAEDASGESWQGIGEADRAVKRKR